jgi:lipoate-protein ligase A
MAQGDILDLSRATWRLLNTGSCDGATNMAIDEAIMLAVAEERSPPTLRFYGWRPPCVSVGYAQSLRGEIDLDACLCKGYTWVRRPTGGRAVLHIDELTYSVTAPQAEPRVAGDILASYRRLSLGLVVGLRVLGCDAMQAEPQAEVERADRSAACFDVPSHYEVTALGRKLIGSAQVRRRGVVLQHGALPLNGDVSRLADVLALPEPDCERLRHKLRSRAVALGEVLGRKVSLGEVAAALAKGFTKALNLELIPRDLSAYERELTGRLQARYVGDEWTFSR